MKSSQFFPISLFIGWLWLGLACSDRNSAGNTMETENSFALQVTLPNGAPAAKVSYVIRPTWLLSDSTLLNQGSPHIFTGTTNRLGWLTVDSLPPGSYVIQFHHQALGAAFTFDHLESETTTPPDPVRLDSLGSVKGQVILPASTAQAWIQVYGLNVLHTTQAHGSFTLDSLPPGPFRLTAWDPQTATILAEFAFQVVSGKTMDLGVLPTPSLIDEDPINWSHSKRLSPSLFLYDWMQPLALPSVLTLEMDSSLIDFSKAMPDGKDIRIVNASGAFLSVKRVQWSSSRATLQVRLNNPSDTLGPWHLLYGKPLAIEPGYPNVWEGISDSIQQAFTTVKVDDFENHSNVNALPSPIPTSFWFLNHSDSGSILPETPTQFSNLLDSATNGREGMALHIRYQANTPEWILVGTSLGKGPHNLSALDSIVFWLRGDGTVSVAFENNAVEFKGKKAWKHIDPTDDWQRYVITPQDFMAPDSIGGNVGWNAICDSITNLSFFASNGTEFWLDDIRLHGIHREHLR